MKKTILILAVALCATCTALAGTQHLQCIQLNETFAKKDIHRVAKAEGIPLSNEYINEESMCIINGDKQPYAYTFYYNTWLGKMAFEDTRANIVFGNQFLEQEKNRVYINNLLAGNQAGYVRGTLNEAQDTITIINGQPVGAINNSETGESTAVYFVTASVENGTATINEECHFTINEDKTMIKYVDEEVDTYYMLVDAQGNIYSYNFMNSYELYTGALDVVVPQDAIAEEYIFEAQNGRDENYVPVATTIYHVGDTYYLPNLCQFEPQSYVIGTLKDNVITVESNQAAGQENNFWWLLRGAYHKALDVSPWDSYNWKDSYNFYVTGDTIRLDTIDVNSVITTFWSLPTRENGIIEKPYYVKFDRKPAIPSPIDNPRFGFSEGLTWLQFDWDFTDVDGNRLDPMCLAFEVFVEDELFTFTPEVYTTMAEPMSRIPYMYSTPESSDMMNIYGYEKTTCFYFPTTDFYKISIRVAYTINGVTNFSEFYDFINEEHSGINDVTTDATRQVVETSYYDIMGHKIESPINNQICIKVQRFDDGTSTTSKIVNR